MAKVTAWFLVFVVGVAAAQRVMHTRKPGDCPPSVEIGICQLTCRMDLHCADINKCCRTACGGSVCVRPVTERRPNWSKPKPGVCPAKPTGPWVCTSRCAYDTDCRGTLKCCRNRCGATACMKPEYN